MPEDRRLIGSLTVQENILLPIWAQGKKKTQDSLDHLRSPAGGQDVASYRAAQLSGGQQN